MAVNHRIIGEFNPDHEDWVSYTERLTQYFIANGIEAEGDKRRAILLSSCGAPTYQLIRNLVAPGNPTDKTFSQIVTLVPDHHQSRPSTIVQRFNFHTRIQKSGESISEYVAQLRKLSEYCEFGDTLEDMLLNDVVCGCRDQRLQCKLLAEADLTFEKAFKIAKAMETAEKEARDVQETPAAPIHATEGLTANKRSSRKPPVQQQQPQKASATDCYRCGGRHKASECKFCDVDCNFCKKKGSKKGHIALKVCRSRLKLQKSQTYQLHTTDEPACELQEYSLFHTPGSRNSPRILISLKINGVNMTMELDTGATLSLISESTYREMFPAESAPQLKVSQAPLKTYTGESIKIKGAIDVEVVYNGQYKQLYLLIVEGEGPSLLG